MIKLRGAKIGGACTERGGDEIHGHSLVQKPEGQVEVQMGWRY